MKSVLVVVLLAFPAVAAQAAIKAGVGVADATGFLGASSGQTGHGGRDPQNHSVAKLGSYGIGDAPLLHSATQNHSAPYRPEPVMGRHCQAAGLADDTSRRTPGLLSSSTMLAWCKSAIAFTSESPSPRPGVWRE